MFLYSLLSTYAVEIFEPIALWTTVGVLACVLLTGFILFLAKRKAVAPFAKYALFGFAVYLLALAITFFALDIAKNYSDSYTEKNWLDKQALIKYMLIPLLVLSCVSLLSLTSFALVAKFRPQAKKAVGIVCACVFAVALISALVCVALYYREKIVNDGWYNSDTASVKQVALYLSAPLSLALIIGLAFLDKQKLSFNARSLAYAGICVAMSFALSYIKLWDMPSGGSVTLVSLLPLAIYAYIFGAKKGVFVGFVYGVLQAVQDPWIIHPAQFLLDYPIAFSAVGLAGLFRKVSKTEKLPWLKFILGGLITGTLRFICHVFSGVFAFSANAGTQNVWLFSLGYNAYVFVDIALVCAVGAVLLSSKGFLSVVTKIQTQKSAQ